MHGENLIHAPEKVTHGMEVSPETAEKIMLRIMGSDMEFSVVSVILQPVE